MNDKQQLAAMGEHVASMKLTIHGHGINSEEEASGGFLTRYLPCSSQQQQTPCMAKRIEELEAQLHASISLLKELRDGVEGEWCFPGDLDERIDALLDGQAQEAAPDAMVSLSDIASLHRYTLGGHCDSFGQDCEAEMEQDDEGEHILLAEALMLAAAPNPEAK